MTEEKKVSDAPEPQSEAPDAEIARLKDQLLRLHADFENARKRWRKEQAEIQERANADLLRELLEIHDDFQRALSAAKTDDRAGTVPAGEGMPRPGCDAAPNSLIAGVEMISRRLHDFLKSYGIQPLEAEGKLFDPALHEAVAHEVTESVPEGTVLSELRRGYAMNGRVLRTAVVKVASRPETKSESKEESDHGTSNRD